MAYVSVSEVCNDTPTIKRMDNGWVSIMYPSAKIHIALSPDEAVELTERLADFLGGVRAVEVAA